MSDRQPAARRRAPGLLPTHVRVTCGGPAHGGEMVARHEGRVIFVSGALPGEDVTIDVTEEKKSFARAHVVDIHTAHPQRRDHRCAAAAAGAGCCSWDTASIALQRSMKAQIVTDLLQRLGGVRTLPWEGQVTPLPGEVGDGSTGWRVRQRVRVSSEGGVGSLAPHSHDVIAQSCAQVVPLLSGTPADWGIAHKVASLAGTETELVLAADSLGERHIMALTRAPRRRTTPRSGGTPRRLPPGRIERQELLAGSGMAVENVLGQQWRIPADAFWQAHHAAATTYAALVRDCANMEDGDISWDLYGGCGIFAHALSLATNNPGPIVSVDTSAGAIQAGKEAFQHAGRGIEMVESTVVRWLHSGANAYATPATVVLDPPRAGVGREVVAAVAHYAPRTIIHFGCDAAAFARDVRLWQEAGYSLSALHVYDGFPNTPHMECVCLLSRAKQ